MSVWQGRRKVPKDSPLIYRCKRFWCPRTGSYSLADKGYLVDPEADYARTLQPDVVGFEMIEGVPCLALLGEPGIGKSTALERCVEVVRSAPQPPGDHILVLNLNQYGSEDRLERRLTDAPEIHSWVDGSGTLHLFLDSLDECRAHIPTVAALVLGVLRGHRTRRERLRLRFACRTAEWPEQLDTGLKDLWKDDGFRAYELLPLRRVDVEAAARVMGVDAGEFLTAVEVADAQPLAIKPLTLKMLLELHKGPEGLPSTQVELYQRGCQLLCTETNLSRLDSRAAGSLDPSQRLVVAARIATVLNLCGKDAVSLDPVSSYPPAGAVPITALAGGREEVRGIMLDVGEAAIREALRTGLFSSRGLNLLGVAHQTYAEFLTANYLHSHGLDQAQLNSLFCHTGDPDHRLVPQLAETAAWLASMDRAFFRRVMATDPHVLLRSDGATADHQDRHALLEAYLEKLEHGQLLDSDLGVRQRYGRFCHPALYQQLHPYITGRSKALSARLAAIDIAEAAAVEGLANLLVSVAMDPDEDVYVRYRAAHAVSIVGSDEHRRQLIPLLNTTQEEDPDDQLRGTVMRTVWPRRLVPLNKMLGAMAPPRRRSLMGAYEMFLAQEFVPHVRSDEVPTVLDWWQTEVGSKDADHKASAGLCQLADALVVRALGQIEDAKTLRALALYVRCRLLQHQDIFSSRVEIRERSELFEHDERRRRLARAILEHDGSEGTSSLSLTFGIAPILGRADFEWTLDQARSALSKNLSEAFAVVARDLMDTSSPAHVDVLVASARESEVINKVFAPWLTPIELGSDAARRERDRPQNIHQDPQPEVTIDPPMTERVKVYLDRLEAGDTDAWWHLNHCMTFNHAGRADDQSVFEEDLRELPGWKDADDVTRRRIVAGAKLFLRLGDPHNDRWIGTNTLHRPALAGYRAMVLLAHEEPKALAGLTPELWDRWAGAIVGFPSSSSNIGNPKLTIDLVHLAYEHAPEAVIFTLLRIIDKEDREYDRVSMLQKVAGCWDARLCRAVLEKLKGTVLKPSTVGGLIGELLTHRCDGALEYAASLVPTPPPPEGQSRERSHQAALALLEHADDAGWSIVWPVVTSDTDFGRKLIEALAMRDRMRGDIATRLSEEQAAEHCIWLSKQYPHEEDPQHDDAHFIGPREAVAHLRDAVLRTLESRGTPQAVAAIRRIADELPNLPWLCYAKIRAREQMLRHTWTPPAAAQVLALCSRPRSRLVRSAVELQDLLLEALDEIDTELQDETPAAPELWNLPTSPHDRNTPTRPKSEEHLSDWLKRRLNERLTDRGIVAMREVEIRRGEGTGASKGAGEQTDLHVITCVPGMVEGSYEQVRVIIEVKGCWHPDLKNAMSTQLVDRYLEDNTCQHGIYVVGWFQCNQWDDGDQRKVRTPAWTLTDARRNFEEQAKLLSTPTRQVRASVLNTALR